MVGGPQKLRMAAMAGNLKKCTTLVATGADVNEASLSGLSPLLSAADRNHFEVVRFLVTNGAIGNKALHMAIGKGNLAMVQCLVESGVPKEASDEGRSPLQHASMHGSPSIVEYLLEQGCDVDHANDYGYTPLHYAAHCNNFEVAQLLLRFGAKLDLRNNGGRTAADVATQYGHHDIANAIRAEEIRRRDHGFKRDRSTIEGTEEHEAAKRPRVEEPEAAVDESDDDDDDDDDDDEEDA